MTYQNERSRFLSENVKQSDESGCRKPPKWLFPTKLWDALDVPRNDNNIIRWNEDGTSVLMDSNRLEKHVKRRYPGLLRIPTLANFRRQMNWYGFEWELGDSGILRFTHPCFKRDRRDLLGNVLTRRRSYSATSINLSSGRRSFRETRFGKKFLTRKQRTQTDESSDDDDSSLKSVYGCSTGTPNCDLSPKSTDIFEPFAPFPMCGRGQNETAPSIGNMIHVDNDAPEWMTYCAPYAPSEDGDILRLTTKLNMRKVTIPVYFYDDIDMDDSAEDIFEDYGEYCLQGVPTAQPVELNDQPAILHREITSIYKL